MRRFGWTPNKRTRNNILIPNNAFYLESVQLSIRNQRFNLNLLKFYLSTNIVVCHPIFSNAFDTKYSKYYFISRFLTHTQNPLALSVFRWFQANRAGASSHCQFSNSKNEYCVITNNTIKYCSVCQMCEVKTISFIWETAKIFA